MRCYVQTCLPIPAEAAWTALKKPLTLVSVSQGFLTFVEADQFPAQWQEGDVFQLRLALFGCVLSPWKHDLRITKVNEAERVICSKEQGGFYTWDHTMRVAALAEGSCQYSDEIEIHAGLLTWPTWLYANVYYRYRHARWRKMAANLGATPAV